jgi:hypothetical protein
MTRSLRLLSMSLLVAVTGCAWAQMATGTFDRTLSVGSPLELDVQTGSGAITIRAGAEGTVVVHGEIHVGGWRASEADEIVENIKASPPIELDGNTLRIGRLDESYWRKSVSISYEIVVPAATRVRSRTGSGSQTVTGLAGPVRVESGSGSAALTDIGGATEASTGSGSIRATGIAGAFTGRAGSGRIEVAQTARGDVAVSTGSGSIELKGVDGALRARAGSGSITIDGTPAGEWDIETGSGSVRAHVPNDAAFTLDVQAGSGGVSTSHPVTIEGAVGHGQLRGQVRGGGPTVRIRTGSGGVSLD